MRNRSGTYIKINKPEYFRNEEFLKLINNPYHIFTWHSPGKEANEYSDVILWYEKGEDNLQELPEDIANDIEQEVGKYIDCGLVWITNLVA